MWLSSVFCYPILNLADTLGGPFVHTVPNYLADFLVFGFAA